MTDGYIVASEPHMWERAEAWNFASCQWTGNRTIVEGSPKDRRRDIEGEQNKSNCEKCDFLILFLAENVII